VKFFYSKELGQLVTFANGNTALTAGPTFKRRDETTVQLAIHAADIPGDAAIELLDASSLQLGMKAVDDYTGPLVVNGEDWTWNADELCYEANVSLNTYQLARLFVEASALNNQTGTTYTLAIADATKLVTLANASAITVTIPTNASVAIPEDSVIYLMRGSSGEPTLSTTGITVTYGDSLTSTLLPNTVYKLTKTGADAWTVSLADELPSVELMMEITGLDGDSSQTLTCTIENDVVRGDEVSPVNAENPDNYWTKTESDARYLQTLADGSIATAKLADDAVTAAKLADNAVVTANITDGNVTTAKLADDAVTAAKLADNAVITANITDANVTTAKLADGAVTSAKLADGAIATAKLADISGVAGTVRVKSVTINGKGIITGYKVKYSASITAVKTLPASTADQDAFTLTIPANVLEAGDVIEWEMYGTTTNGTTASSFLTWVKVNGTKSTAVTHAMGTSAASNVGWHVTGRLWVESTSSVRASFKTSWKLTQGFSISNPWTVALNSTGLTLTPGCNFSVATGVSGTIATACATMQ
jgi:hypothetical protein